MSEHRDQLLPPDTSAEAAAIQRDAQRELGPEDRVRLAVQMSEDVRALMLQGLRSHHPEASEAALRKLVFRRIYGKAWAGLAPGE